ncbi:hypothetical protein RclHR1_04630008 [Rhizophagus clarus]|uniref:Ion transport domain-containing protein n=1 Tax=Rhizophagus clarus TaxID=94130 RepID=A0A2Z6S0Z2_9GLOM|nr:hypothetical protein RclHR1_04630008 [Rhizophagus clarus]
MDDVHALFKEVISDFKGKRELTLIQNLIKWEINNLNDIGVELQIFQQIDVNKWNLICKRVENFNNFIKIFLLGIKLLNNDDILLLTTIGLFIYHFNEKKRSITLKYFYYMKSQKSNELLYFYKKVFSKQNLPLSNCDSFKISDGWVMDIKDNKECLLKYGVELLKFAIKDQKLELIDDIYKKCINYFREDLRINKIYSLETTMIIDYPSYNIEYKNNELHLYSFQYPQIINITRSILWIKYNILMGKLSENHMKIFIVIQLLIILLIIPLLPIYFIAFYILSKYHFINDFYTNDVLSLYFEAVEKLSKHRTMPIITFMSSYIKFMNYPKDYNWFLELILPQPSPFVETISNNIYKTLDGEALINFKWNSYGKYYHSMIWITFMALLGCFNTAAKLPQQYIGDNVQRRLLIASIILGFIHLSFEIRRFIYNPAKWMKDIGNLFDAFVYTLPIYTSILWLQTNDDDQIVSIAKRVMFFFLCFIIVILASFAYAFYILLSPKMNYSLDERVVNDDPNNPWNLASTYQVFENVTSIYSNLFILQTPDENTNMFSTFFTSLFATCLLLTGDTSSLSNWPYEKNPSLMILVILFTFIMTIYILNVFITLFGEAMKDGDSYLLRKAEHLAKIELFYLLPNQRRWKSWFPEVIHYSTSVEKARKEIKQMIENKEWNTNVFPELKQDLLDKLRIDDN